MAAPSAPIITFRGATDSSLRLRWAAVTGAATYNVYKEGTQVQSGLTGTTAVVPCGPLDSLTVTAVNIGAEESVASNAVVPQHMGSGRRR